MEGAGGWGVSYGGKEAGGGGIDQEEAQNITIKACAWS